MEKVEDDNGNTRTEQKRKKTDKRIMRPNDMREHEITTGNASKRHKNAYNSPKMGERRSKNVVEGSLTTYVSIRPTAVGNVEVSVAASRLAEELTATERADDVRLVEGLQAGRHG